MTTLRGRQTKARFNPFLALLLIVLAAVGTIATLEATGTTDIFREVRGEEPHPPGIPILASVRALQPGDEIDLSAVFDRQLQQVRKKYNGLTEEEIRDGGFATGYNEVKGRVLKNPMDAGAPFVAADFYPAGTQPGISALVPEDKQLVILDADKVQGLDALAYRDRFDLRVSRAEDEEIAKAAKLALEARPYVSPSARIALAATPKRSDRQLLAQCGMVIRVAEKRQGKKTQVAVALHPDDVFPVLDALAEDETIYCVAHPGINPRELPRIQPERVDPTTDYAWLIEERGEVDVIKGNKRTTEMVPKPR